MLLSILLFLPASLISAGLCSQVIMRTTTAAIGKSCCEAIYREHPSMVFHPPTPEYQSRLKGYFSFQQQELLPTCRVMPASASDVSCVLQIATANNCPFAVCSGGQMSWKGASNINGGIVIDLRRMNQVDISREEERVKLGPGSIWGEVYSAMAPFNVTTFGGRVAQVGVGGFLLGGGISFLSPQKGFSANNVLNYEVVLSNGTIVEANKDIHTDLYWALKMGGSNYGIVTRFDLPVIHLSTMWGSVSQYRIDSINASDVLSNIRTQDPRDITLLNLGHANGEKLAFAFRAYLGPSAREPLSSAIPIMHREKLGSFNDVLNEVFDGDKFISSSRVRWYTLTVKFETDFFLDLYAKSMEIFSAFKGQPGVRWDINFQTIAKTFIEASSDGPSFKSLKGAAEDLVCILIQTCWTNAADDAVLEENTQKLGAWAESEASRRGLLNEFVYLNYANERQSVYERSVVGEDLVRMQKVKQMYDSDGTFDKLWSGGFKLPKTTFEEPVAVHDRTEL
ncbi:hypothetical protein E1B28_005608 [Marasmius oreades]|uniref:FAD-binding PCMH-type domain-containing protein n=1 Tax=Marasmius oreades TaxID=181124 RepID=A0A9P7S406_9AGAR|nr:uncharacterized protein E1B28_005608 [Marasmius oreades]KAG7094793.1 hypothetical protein E1B28_005608 [Marasmius oreades]